MGDARFMSSESFESFSRSATALPCVTLAGPHAYGHWLPVFRIIHNFVDMAKHVTIFYTDKHNHSIMHASTSNARFTEVIRNKK